MRYPILLEALNLNRFLTKLIWQEKKAPRVRGHCAKHYPVLA